MSKIDASAKTGDDADLFALLEEWREAEHAGARLFQRAHNTDHGLPERPQELYWRHADEGLFHLLMPGALQGGPPTHGFFDQEWLDERKERAEASRRSTDPFWVAYVARYDEISRALDAWNEARERARIAKGLPQLEAAYDAAAAEARRLCRCVIDTPARTVPGLVEKLRVASTLHGVESLLEDLEEDRFVETVFFSAALDVHRIPELDPSRRGEPPLFSPDCEDPPAAESGTSHA